MAPEILIGLMLLGTFALGPELIIGLILLGTFGLWVYALVDAIRVPDDSMFRAGNKIIWVLVIVFAHFIGAILYLLLGRPSTTATRPYSSQLPPPPRP